MEKKEAAALIGPALRILALGFVAAAILKMFGIIVIRPGVLELSAVAIALSQAK